MRATAGLWVGVIGGALSVSVVGCRQVLGVDGYGTKGEYAGNGFLYSSQTCRDCVDKHCGSEATLCGADLACKALAQCFARCTPDDHSCRGKCNLSIPDTREMRELVRCEANNRCTDCGSSRAVWDGAACDDYMAQHCPSELDAFSKDRGALEANACQRECPKSAPECACGGYSDAGGEPQALTDVRACADGCNPTPPDWSCLGNVQWPLAAPSLKRLDFHFRAIKVVDDTPVQYLWVEACHELDTGCDIPPGDAGIPDVRQKTSTEGWASLSIGQSTTDLGFFGHLVASAPDYSALLYLFPPPRLSPSWRTLRMVSKSMSDTIATSALGVTPRWDSKGGIVWSVTSCNKPSAEGVKVSVEGVQVSIDTREHVNYSSSPSGLPDKNLQETTSVGLGVIVNVEPGYRLLTAKVTTLKQVIGTYPVQVKAGTITHVAMAPGP